MSDIHDLAAAYLLDDLSEADSAAFAHHLAQCAACQAEISELEAGTEAVFWESAEPAPSSLHRSVTEELDQVAEVVPLTQRWGPLVGAVAAALLLVVVISISLRPNPIQAVIDAPDAVAIEVVPTDANTDADVTVTLTYSSNEDAAVVTATGLDEVSDDQTYEMWIIDQTGPSPAGVFRPDESGEASVLVEALPEPGTTFGITVEPAGGSELPTGDVLFAADVS